MFSQSVWNRPFASVLVLRFTPPWVCPVIAR